METCAVVWWVHISKCFWKIMNVVSSGQNKEDHPDFSQCKVWKPVSVMVCVSAHDMTFRDVPAYFSKTHSVRVKTAWLRSKRVWVLDWSACSPDLQSIGNAWRIMKRKIWQRRPQTVEGRKSYIKQDWEKNPPTKLQQLVSSVPKHLSVVRRKGDVTQW